MLWITLDKSMSPSRLGRNRRSPAPLASRNFSASPITESLPSIFICLHGGHGPKHQPRQSRRRCSPSIDTNHLEQLNPVFWNTGCLSPFSPQYRHHKIITKSPSGSYHLLLFHTHQTKNQKETHRWILLCISPLGAGPFIGWEQWSRQVYTRV